jgi:phospholipase/carboxylesterase
MAGNTFQGIELLPETREVKQLFILLHGVGARPSNLMPLATKIRAAYPDSAILIPEGITPFDGVGIGRQWFSVKEVTEENRVARVIAAMPFFYDLIHRAQDRFNVLQPDTALIGFSQGAIMALEYSVRHDGNVGRVLAFSGRFAKLPEKAPELTTLHLLHGEDDRVIPVEHAHAAYKRLADLNGDVTLDIASAVGHDIHDALADRALYRLQTCIPLRSWKMALSGT